MKGRTVLKHAGSLIGLIIISLLSFFNLSAQTAHHERIRDKKEITDRPTTFLPILPIKESRPTCSQQLLHHHKMQTDPAYAAKYNTGEEKILKKVQELMKNSSKKTTNYRKATGSSGSGSGGGRTMATVYTIPVVVFVVHPVGEPVGTLHNPSRATIEAGINHLTMAFRKMAPYNGITSADVELEFCLAQRTSGGTPSPGIIRIANNTYTDLDASTEDVGLKALAPAGSYNSTDYMKIWLVREICDDPAMTSCGTAGYAYLSSAHGSPIDGIVNEARWFGTSIDNSKVHIHEAGHYFNLLHTFEGGCANTNCLANGDKVCDTPPDNSSNPSDPCTGINSCTTDPLSGFISDVDDYGNNFMDYSDATCQDAFTAGQVTRMRTALDVDRASLKTSPGCTPVAPTIDFTVDVINEAEANFVSGPSGCRRYKDITLTLKIAMAPTGTATVNLSATGSATAPSDFEFLPSATVIFPNASTANQTVTLRLYDDAAVEGPENATISFTITGATNAIVGVIAPTIALSIEDNDYAPGSTITLLSQDFESGLGGWTNSAFAPGPGGLTWVANTGIALAGTRSGYITNNAAGSPPPYTYTTGTVGNPILIAPGFSTVGMTGINISFKWRCQGEVGGGDRCWLMYRTAPAGIFTLVPAPAMFNSGATNTYTGTLPAACNNQAYVQIGFYFQNDGDGIGTQPPIALDDILVTYQVPNPPVETAVSTKQEYLGPNSTVFYISSTNKIMAKIENLSSHDFGCTTVQIDRAGTGATAWNGSALLNHATDKTLLITPTNPNPAANVKVTMYFTGAERTGWEAGGTRNWNSADLFRTTNAISANDPTGFALGTATVRAAYATTENQVTSNFSIGAQGGFAYRIDAPIANTITTGTITGSPFCAGQNVTIPFTFTGTFTGTWSAELSTAAGTFPGTAMVTVGAPTIGAGTGSITATIPAATPTGTTYRIRIKNTTPAIDGTPNTVDLTINASPVTPTGLTGSSITCTGFTASWNASAGAVNYTLEVSTDAGHTLPITGSPFTVAGLTQAITGLTAGTTYYFRVRANNAGCNSAYSANQTVVTNAISGVPTALNSSAIGCTGFTAGWTAPVGPVPTNYTLEVSLDAGHTAPVAGSPFTVAGLTQVITGLTAGTTYYFRVRSNNGCGSSAFTANQTVTTNSAPPIPTALNSSAIGCTGFTAGWNAAAGAADYTLEVSLDAGHTAPVAGSPFTVAGVSQVISGLTAGTTYYFRVRSNNGCGSSAFTANQTVTTNSAPPIPTALNSSAIGCTGFTAGWNASAGAVNYTLEVSTDAGHTAPVAGSPFTVAGLTQVITGLTPGTTYFFRVRANGASCNSFFTANQTVTTNSAPPTPTGLTGSSITCTGFTAGWNASAGAVNYTLEVSTDALHTSPITGSPFTIAGLTQAITGLTAGTTYYFRVRANNAGCNSAYSANQTVTTNAISGVPTGLNSSAIGCTGFTAGWNAAAGAVNYTLEVSTDAGHTAPVAGSPFTVAGLTQAISGLTAGTTYYFRVRSNNACGSSLFTLNQTVTTNSTPGVPTGLNSSAIGCTGFTAGWNASAGAADYTLEVSTDALHTSPVAGSPFTVAGISQAISGLAAGTTYYFRVRSNNACGSSLFTLNQTVTTNSTPGVPTGLNSSAIGCTGFTAGWNAAAGAVNYTLEVSTDAGHTAPVAGSPFTVAGISQAISGLTAGTTYYFRVRSNNACGSSGFTLNQTVVTLAIPGMPGASPATGVNCNDFTANWGSVVGATGYQLDVATDLAFTAPITGSPFSTAATSQLVTGLLPGTTYYYRVRASNACGTSANSTTITAVTNTCATSLSISSLSPAGPYCAGDSITVNFTITGAFVAGNVFTVQLSNASGSFATPVNLTPTLTATTGSSLKVGIPAGTALGTGYRVRILGSNPATTSPDNGTDLTINPALAAPVINPLTNVLCNQLTINWQSVTGATNYRLEVSGNPSFTAPVAGSPFTVAGLTQVITGLTAGTTYYYRVRANGTPCNGVFTTTQNATTPACPTITTTTVTPAGPYCAGGTMTVDFTATGTFGAGNVFTVQLSDASGSFAAPTNLTPTLSATTPASMTVTIPGATPVGTGYRVRVVASNPVVTIGTQNATDLSIITVPSVAPTVLAATAVACNGFTANWTAVAGATDYQLEVDDDMLFGSPITGGPITVSAATSYVIAGGLSSSTTYYYRVRAKNTCGNGPFSTAMTTTTASCPTITTGTISGSPFCAGATVTIPFTFTAGFTGTWTAEISTASGAFPGTVMTTVGSPVIGAGSGTIVAQIPLTTAAGTTYRIRVNNSAPGVSGTDNGVNLQVLATPIIVPGPTLTVCRNAGPITLTGFSPAGGTWSGPSVTPAGVFTPSGITITSLPQVVELIYTVTSAGCTNSAIRSIVLVDTPAISLSASPINVCLASAPFNLTAAPFGGTWSGTGVAAGGLFTPATAGVGTHTLTYSYTDGNGCVGTKTQQVVVNSSPNVSYTVTANPVCAGSNGSIELSGSEIGVSYQVRSGTTNIGAPVAGTGAPLSLPVLASALTGPVHTFNILATPTAAACAQTLTNTATINVNIKPATTFTLSNVTVCNGSAAVLNLSGSEVGVSYQLKSPTNGNVVPAVLGTGSALTFTIPADSLLSSPMNFTLVATGSVGGCVSTFATPATVTKVAVPNVSFAVSGDSVCQGNAGQIRLSGSETGVNYLVFRGPIAVGTPVAGTGSALNISIAAADLVPGANTFEVRAANASCSATFGSLATITVTAAPSFAGITVTAAKVCLGNDGIVSINPSAIGVNYQLKAGSALIGSSVGGTGSGITITVPAISLTAGINVFTLEASGPSGCLTGFGSPVQVEAQPAPNTGYTYSADPVCPGQAARVVLSGSESGATYQLLNGITPVSAVVAGTGDSIVFTVAASNLVGGINSFTLEVKTAAGCATTFANPVRIEVKKLDVSFLLTGNKVCAGQDGEVLLSNSETGVSYQLYRDGTNQPVGAAQTGTGSGLSFTVPASDLPVDGIAEFRMEASILGCKEFFPAVATITIIPRPAAPRALGAKRCDVGTVVLSATGGVEIRWYDVPAGGAWLATGSTFTTPVLTTTTTYYVASADGACESERIPVEAIVFPVVKPIISSTATEIEINTSVKFTVTNPVAATRYEWYSDTTHVGSGVEFQMNFPNVGAFNIKVKAVDENLCSSESEVIVIKAGTKQSSSTFTGSPLIGVAPLEVQFKANSPDGTTSWFWEFGDSTTSTDENPLHVYTQVGFYTVTLTRVTAGITIQETKTAYVQVKSVSGMDDLTERFSYQLYPNPSDGRFEISTDNQSVQRLEVELIDMSGKTILKSVYTGRKVRIDKRDIAGGVYTLVVNGVSMRLVIQ